MTKAQQLGKLWFKYRSFSPIPLLVLAIFFPKYNLNNFRFNLLLGLFFILLGELGRIWCVGYAGGITRTRTGDLDKLVTSGPFAYVRNPIYISNIIMYIGATILLGSSILIPVAIIYFFVQYHLIVAYEENLLEASFKEEYLKYKKTIRKWIPSLYIKMISSGHVFRFNEAIYSERRTLTSIGIIVFIAIIKHYIWTAI